MVLSKSQATAIGMLAPLLWGMSVGLIRSISETFGLTSGLSLMYIFGAIYASLAFGRPSIKRYSLKYLIFGIGSAMICSLCFGFSLFLSDGGQQTIEVGMVNYLWPCLTVIFTVLFNGQKARWWLLIGFVLSLYGIAQVLSGEGGINLKEISEHFHSNPASYLLALTGAVAWAAFCSFTRAWAKGGNPTALIFTLEAIVFSTLWLCGIGHGAEINVKSISMVALGAVVMSSAYGFWTIGVLRGRMTILAIASYFTPVLSCLFASFWLHAPLTSSFWFGVAFVVAGSLICWLATNVGERQ